MGWIVPAIIGAGMVGSAIIGSKKAGDANKRSTALQNEAIAMERQRQKELEARFRSLRPLREQSLTNMLAMGSTENPFSRRLSDETQTGIIDQIRGAQTEAGLFASGTPDEAAMQQLYGGLESAKAAGRMPLNSGTAAKMAFMGRLFRGGTGEDFAQWTKLRKYGQEKLGLNSAQASELADAYLGDGLTFEQFKDKYAHSIPQTGGGALI